MIYYMKIYIALPRASYASYLSHFEKRSGPDFEKFSAPILKNFRSRFWKIFGLDFKEFSVSSNFGIGQSVNISGLESFFAQNVSFNFRIIFYVQGNIQQK